MTLKEYCLENEKINDEKIERFIVKVEEALREVDFSQEEEVEWDSLRNQGDKAVRRYSKYEGYERKQKVKSALYRKGFPIELIERYLDEIQQEIGE